MRNFQDMFQTQPRPKGFSDAGRWQIKFNIRKATCEKINQISIIIPLNKTTKVPALFLGLKIKTNESFQRQKNI